MGRKRKTVDGLYYLSAPMETFSDQEALATVALRLRQQGFTILSPAEVDYSATSMPSAGLRLGLRMLTQSNNMILLPGWEKNNRCVLELCIARASGHEVSEVFWTQEGELVLAPASVMKDGINNEEIISILSNQSSSMLNTASLVLA